MAKHQIDNPGIPPGKKSMPMQNCKAGCQILCIDGSAYCFRCDREFTDYMNLSAKYPHITQHFQTLFNGRWKYQPGLIIAALRVENPEEYQKYSSQTQYPNSIRAVAGVLFPRIVETWNLPAFGDLIRMIKLFFDGTPKNKFLELWNDAQYFDYESNIPYQLQMFIIKYNFLLNNGNHEAIENLVEKFTLLRRCISDTATSTIYECVDIPNVLHYIHIESEWTVGHGRAFLIDYLKKHNKGIKKYRVLFEEIFPYLLGLFDSTCAGLVAEMQS